MQTLSHCILTCAIAHSSYIRLIKQAFQDYPSFDRPHEAFLELLQLSLTNNDFNFDGAFFLQIRGIAMGRTYAPAATNIYLRKFDQKAMYSFHVKPKLYGRFLDDIICLTMQR